MGQVKFVEDSLVEADHINSNFLKAVFRKFYLVHSWIFCPIYLNWYDLKISLFISHEIIVVVSVIIVMMIIIIIITIIVIIMIIKWGNWFRRRYGDRLS